EYEDNKREALSKTRPIDEDLHLKEIGWLKVQIIYQPSFDKNYVWDIREKEKDGERHYELYENQLESKKTIAPGYKKLGISSDELLHLINKIYSIKLSLAITPMEGCGLDGILYGLNIYENYYRFIKITWWERPQDNLIELSEVLKKYIEIFKETKEKKDID
ncbi:MAG: hypothetical protein H7Z75_11355, partial [Ferruginibacter sp.]|nr:hypothetical protein [Cytophagales bacterium]